jgi:hypothetical protein
MTVQTLPNGTLFILSKPLDTRAKTLYLIHSIFLGVRGILLFYPAFDILDSVIGTTILLALCAAQLISSYRFAHAAMLQEHIFIDGKELFLITKGIGTRKRLVFDLASITNFRSLEKPVMAAHPLAGQSFDYLGFQTEQQVINEMHGDNRVAFDYEGKTIKFGKNIYSWEFDEILDTLKKYGCTPA